jgi:hypothetical protein
MFHPTTQRIREVPPSNAGVCRLKKIQKPPLRSFQSFIPTSPPFRSCITYAVDKAINYVKINHRILVLKPLRYIYGYFHVKNV